ncbi:hypothetical protein N7523_010660, partial [Penicillium sp. IBT 18751x]
MDQQVSPRLSSDMNFFNWEDFHRASLPEPSRPSFQGSATSDIASLLSSRSQPLPDSYNSRSAQNSASSSIPGDLALGLVSYPSPTNTNSASVPKPTAPRPQKCQRRGPKKAVVSAKNLGATREVHGSKENPEERRRTQTRLAQRAYRSRQQASVAILKDRISLLENSMEKMSSAMLSFSENLVQSGVLRSHSALTANLRDTMMTFLSLASASNIDDERRVSVDFKKTIDSNKVVDVNNTVDSLSSQKLTIKRPSPNNPVHLHSVDTALSLSQSDIMPHTVNSPGTSSIEISDFIERLLLAALYQGHLALCNPSIGLDQLQRPFGLIFRMMSRENLTSYFKAKLYAQVSRKQLDGWEEVPFFRLGGAGNHYPGPLTRDKGTGSFDTHYERWGTVEDPLSLVDADLRKQLEGDWFDLRDLEEYLRDKNVLLVTSVDESIKLSKVQTNINVSQFITALVSRGVCLGRTPGYQRDEVEEALHSSEI